jgi:hypothetical protein
MMVDLCVVSACSERDFQDGLDIETKNKKITPRERQQRINDGSVTSFDQQQTTNITTNILSFLRRNKQLRRQSTPCFFFFLTSSSSFRDFFSFLSFFLPSFLPSFLPCS